MQFRDSATDLHEKADSIAARGRDTGGISSDERDPIYRIAHTLKGLAASCGFSLTSVVAHRFADYLAELRTIEGAQLDGLQKFIDALGDLVDAGPNESKINASEFIRKLPSRPAFDIGDISVQDVEFFVVMPDDAVSRHVMRELQACGYRVAQESNSFTAIEIAAMTRPDPIIVTGMLHTLSGVDIISAFRDMPAIRDLPVAMITGDTREEVAADGLPEAVPVIRKGRDFGDDLTDALTQLGIL